MMEVKKDTILVASVKRRKKQTNKEGKTIMSSSDALAKSFSVSHSGIFGVDEKSMLEILVKWQPEQLSTFRNETSRIFLKDERFPFEKCEEFLLKFLKREFKRFKDAVVQWTMHPWERDARMARKALKRGRQAYGLLIELACTRSSDELLGARRAYQSLYSESIEEDVASRVDGIERQDLDEESSLKDTIYCLCVPSQYFSKILDSAMKANANKNEKEALTRVIVTRANVDMKDIAEEYDRQYKTPLTQKIEDVALGNYKDFLVTLVQRALPKGSD
ncbi:annexin D4 isoform X3 [Vitis vinifera]|uniref:annexin D4 isoform X3 n=1 Tax=Vitis vinifera TaxID=29760 RepID=UPI00053FCFB2|nr:annexin D4 isoform X3 [Vitis vinifera]|eukprot:XP_010659177.1 PREDICTED: annexin D4 isoform X3 [Vitis vinifera]